MRAFAQHPDARIRARRATDDEPSIGNAARRDVGSGLT
jgi:hypothetical protein